MAKMDVSRRGFLQVFAATGLAQLVGCGTGLMVQDPTGGSRGGVVVFKRSGRGMRISNAAKAHNANHLYATAEAAAADLAHPGDRSRVVSVVVSQRRFDELFPGGLQQVDLRHVA